MGGMFTVVKVRDGLGAHDYGDPGPYRHPDGAVAREVGMAEAPSIPRSESPATEAPAGAPGKRGNAAPGRPSRRS
jgi:hypothetical protein